jgi:hypothetical protein
MTDHDAGMPDAVKHAVKLVTHGSPDDWNRHYRTKSMQAIFPPRAQQAVQLEFEYKDRWKLYKCVNDRFIKNAPIDYLEFGVYGGQSFRSWMELNADPESRFFGFDSFEGLPEDWQGDSPKGTFDHKGKAPKIDDPRGTFVVGLFQDSLPSFLDGFAPKHQLVVHFDADLYSSTLYAMMNLDRFVTPGTIFLFDEFSARSYTDEFAALQDYCTACYRDYTVLAMRTDLAKVAIEIRDARADL